jgi:hypothetical protein
MGSWLWARKRAAPWELARPGDVGEASVRDASLVSGTSEYTSILSNSVNTPILSKLGAAVEELR